MIFYLLTFLWGSVSKNFTNDWMNEISLIGTACDLSTEYGLIGRENIIGIYEYFMKKHNFEWYQCWLNMFLLQFKETWTKQNLNWVCLDNQTYITKVIDLNHDRLRYYQFMVSYNRCKGSCDILDILDCSASRTFFPNVAEVVSLNTFIIITWIEESKILKKSFSYKCKCKFDCRISIPKQKYNND